MSYTKTQWNNDTAPAINETNLNKIEQGIYENDSHIGDLTTLTTTANTDLVSAINEVDSHADTNATNIGDLTTLTTTAKSNVVSAVNELDSDKLDTTGTAVNSTKWNNYINDIATENNTSTWIPVMLNEKMQHTTIQSIVDRGAFANVPIKVDSNFTATRLFCRKYGKVVHLHFHGYAKADSSGFYTILTGLPKVYTGGDYPVIAWAQGTTPNTNPTGTRYLWINKNGGLQSIGITKNQYTLIDITYVTID